MGYYPDTSAGIAASAGLGQAQSKANANAKNGTAGSALPSDPGAGPASGTSAPALAWGSRFGSGDDAALFVPAAAPLDPDDKRSDVLVVDSGGFIKNAPLETLGREIFTIPEVIKELRSKDVRDRLTGYNDFDIGVDHSSRISHRCIGRQHHAAHAPCDVISLAPVLIWVLIGACDPMLSAGSPGSLTTTSSSASPLQSRSHLSRLSPSTRATLRGCPRSISGCGNFNIVL